MLFPKKSLKNTCLCLGELRSALFCELRFVLLSEGTFCEGAEVNIFRIALSLNTAES